MICNLKLEFIYGLFEAGFPCSMWPLTSSILAHILLNMKALNARVVLQADVRQAQRCCNKIPAASIKIQPAFRHLETYLDQHESSE